jgi:putative selenium metabolism protein SsnA
MGTLFRNALLVQLDPPRVVAGELRVENGQIAAVGNNLQAQPGDEIVNCGGAVLMPGLVNGHTHLYSALAVGMPAPPRPPRNFHEILQFIWWRLDRAHTLESVEVSGQIGALAALRCGTTTLVDHHASPNAIEGSLTALENGIASVGCRAVLCYEVTDRNGLEGGRAGLAENERYANECRRRADGRFAAMVGAHANFTLNYETLMECALLAVRIGIGIHIHVAEDPIDAIITQETASQGILANFFYTGILDVPDTIFAHGTHLADDDIAVINDYSNLFLAHNPTSNMNNGVGYTPVAKYARPPLLGTDGIGADMWREARVAEFKSHDAGLALPFGTSLQMLAQSARVASKCLGVKLGVLEPGAAADLVLTDYHAATALTADTLASHFLFAMGSEFVRSVMVAGRWCVKDRIVVSCDEAADRANAVSVARALHERMAAM